MKKFKRLVVKIPYYETYKDILQLCERFELLHIYRLDEHSIFTLQTFRFKNSDTKPSDFLGEFGIENLEVISEDKSKNEYICFAKTSWPEELVTLFQIPSMTMCLPVIIEEGSIVISFIVYDKDIDSIFEYMESREIPYKVISISTELSPRTDNIFHQLTEKQRKIILYAIEKGYYEIPRKINTNDLAEKFEISQSAISEHLRKIERIIFQSIFKLL